MSVENKAWSIYRPSPRALTVMKILIGVFLVWVLWKEITVAIQTNNFPSISLSTTAYFWLTTTLMLMILNWFLEAKKWQILARPFQKLSIKNAYKSVLAGLATGLITPNRLGNFIGRLAYIQKANKVQATIHTQMGNLAQFIITITLGIVGLTISLNYLNPIINSLVFIGIPVLLLVLSVWFYMYPKSIIKLPFGQKNLRIKNKGS